MIRSILSRLLSFIPVLIFVSLVAFVLLQLSPGDPAVAAAGGGDATPEAIAAARRRLGLDEPIFVQYFLWIRGLIVGEWGFSFASGLPVLELVTERMGVTLILSFSALFVAALIALPAGLLSAARSGTGLDRAVIFVTTLGICLPDFVIGLLLILTVALTWGWLPAAGFVSPAADPLGALGFLILPSVTLGVAVAAELTRHLRATVRDELQKEYIMTARAKGLASWNILLKHALKNASLPVVTVLGLQLRRLLAGTVIVETIFDIRGVGSLLVRSVFTRDYPVILGVIVASVAVVLVVNLLVDLTYGYLNPKLRKA